MKTLYDLLGALPDDDAEEIRAAFRKAVKESHPDVNPGDPDAALRFRQVIRANDILGEKEQRTAYDRLLCAAQDEHRQESKLAVVAKVHKVASGVMALAGASAMALTGYLLFTHMSSASVASLKPIVVATNKVKPNEVPAKPIESALVAPDTEASGEAASNAGSEAAANSAPGSTSGANTAASAEPLPLPVSKVDAVYSAEQEHAPCPQGTTGACGSDAVLPGGTTSNEARAYHDRGMASFQNGDLTAALTNLDAAIQLDPRYQEAYIDRGIVFYRMRKFDRAFADVAAAKRLVFGKVGIDMIAGPSEVLVIADDSGNADWIAADLLAQAEHDASAQSILITDSRRLADDVARAVEGQLKTLPRAEIAAASWADFGAIIEVDHLDEAVPLADAIAAEHLEIMTADPDAFAARVRNAGAIFLGAHTPEAIGDYVGGSNHVLPTARSARFSSGLGVLDFMKRTSLLKCGPDQLRALGPAAMTLGKAEGLEAHSRSVGLRLNLS